MSGPNGGVIILMQMLQHAELDCIDAETDCNWEECRPGEMQNRIGMMPQHPAKSRALMTFHPPTATLVPNFYVEAHARLSTEMPGARGPKVLNMRSRQGLFAYQLQSTKVARSQVQGGLATNRLGFRLSRRLFRLPCPCKWIVLSRVYWRLPSPVRHFDFV